MANIMQDAISACVYKIADLYAVSLVEWCGCYDDVLTAVASGHRREKKIRRNGQIFGDDK